jgi:transposase InsO family protein
MLPAAILQPMKREELYFTKYRSENEFRKAVADDIERYNTQRPHTTLQYKTPQQVEADFQVAARK